MPNTLPPRPTGDPPERPEAFVVVPYVEGMLRDQTHDAISAWGGTYVTYPIDAGDREAYAAGFKAWWQVPMDLIVIEQDMTPTGEQINALIDTPHEWAGAAYHIGFGRTTTGLGFCKIALSLRERYPSAGENIIRNQSRGGGLADWVSLNENVARHLERLGERMHVLDFEVGHLHYPRAPHG